MPSTQILQQFFAIRPNLRNSFCTIVVILYLVTSCPVEVLLNNVQQSMQSGSYITGRPRMAQKSRLHCVHGNSFLSRNLESLSRDYAAPLRDYATVQWDQSALSRQHASLSSDQVMHNTVYSQRTTQAVPPRLYHGSSCGELTLLVEQKPKKLTNHHHRKHVHRTYA